MHIGFRADQDIADLVDQAMEATGKTKTDIVQAVIRRFMPEAVRQIRAEQGKAADRMDSKKAPDAGAEPRPKDPKAHTSN